MAHYSLINAENKKVVNVFVGKDEDDTENLPPDFESWEEYYESKNEGMICKRTSYNTKGNQHLDGGTAFRGNYAGIGFTYDSDNDVFYEPQPFASWTLNQTNWTWEAPISYPDDDLEYYWDEDVYQADTSDPKTAGWVAYGS